MNYCQIMPEKLNVLESMPNHLSFPFSIWMQNGGYHLTACKVGLTFKKGNKIAKVYGSKKEFKSSHKMNEHCASRFQLFCAMYMNQGQSFIDNLNKQAQSALQSMGKVA